MTLVAAAATMFVLDVLAGPIFSLSTKTWPPEVRGDKVIAGIEGAVKATDRVSGTLLVASGFLGLGSLPLVVTPETEVAINGKLGGVDDLDRGQLVRVAYEVLPDQLLARRIDVLHRAASADAVTPPPISTRNPSAVEAASPPETVSPPAATVPGNSRAVSAPLELPPRRSETATVSPTKRTPARTSTLRGASSPSAPPPAADTPARPAPIVAPRPAPPAASAADGTDAVDWLFKGASAR